MKQVLDQSKLDRPLLTYGSLGQCISSRKIVAVALGHVSVDGDRVHRGTGRYWTERSVAWNHRPDLFEDLFGFSIFQRRAEKNRKRRQDFPVGAAVPHRIDRGPNGLHMAFGIGEGPGFFHGGGCREYHMCKRSRFREKQFLADKEIEFAQGLFGSDLGRKTPDWILSDDEQSLDDPGAGSFDHLDERGPRCQRGLFFPGTSHLLARALIREVECSWQHCSNRSHFNGSLIIILCRQGSKAAGL